MTAKETTPAPPYISNGIIHLGEFPRNPSERQADAVMRIVSEHFGQTWLVVRLSGWWRIMCQERSLGWGADAGQRTRNFSRALAEATGLTVERTDPPKLQG